MFRITVTDLSTGDTLTQADYEHVETTTCVGAKRLDADGNDGSQPPQIVQTGAYTLLVQAWSGEGVGMTKFEDFVNFTDDTGNEPDPGPMNVDTNS